MRGRGGIIAAALATFSTLVLTLPGWAAVGDAPTLDVKRCDSYSRPCGRPFVLAEGRQLGTEREIVGLKSRLGSCLTFERVDLPWLFSFHCDEDVAPRPKQPLRVELIRTEKAVGPSPNQTRRRTEIGGVLRPDVARVQANFGEAGERRRQDAITNQVDRDLARRVGFNGPVGVFDLVVPGFPLKQPGDLRLKAFDRDGKPLYSRLLGSRIGR